MLMFVATSLPQPSSVFIKRSSAAAVKDSSLTERFSLKASKQESWQLWYPEFATLSSCGIHGHTDTHTHPSTLKFINNYFSVDATVTPQGAGAAWSHHTAPLWKMFFPEWLDKKHGNYCFRAMEYSWLSTSVYVSPKSLDGFPRWC